MILGLVALGIALRGVLLLSALPLDIQSDEANYIYLALGLENFGLYLDQQRYLWPPAYPWLLARAIGMFGPEGLDAVRWLQVAASGVVGGTTMLFAWRLFSRRAALVAGLLWVFHLPLAAYSHLLWNEVFFLALLLPALWHTLRALDVASGAIGGSITARLLASGALFGAALYLKEWPLFLLPLLALIIFVRSRQAGVSTALQRATLLPLMALVVTMPWTLRNHEVYGRVIVSGATLGENAYVGLNARYMNFDLNALRKPRARKGLAPLEELSRPAFVAIPSSVGPTEEAGWPRRDDILHPIDRQKAQLTDALDYAVEHPAWTVRTRVKKLSDLVTPLSFFTRHEALEGYPSPGPLTGALRRPLVLFALGLPFLLMLFASAGFFLTLPAGSGRDIVTAVVVYVLATSLLVAMSRFRVPLEPFLVVLAAGFLSHGPETRSTPRVIGLGVAIVCLFGLWWVSFPETYEVARMALGDRG